MAEGDVELDVAIRLNFTRPKSVFSVFDDVLDLLSSLDVRFF